MNRPIALLAAAAIILSVDGRSIGSLLPAQTVAQPSYQPDRPYEVQADGVLTRREYRTDEAGPFRAEIIDLIVPPGKATTLRYEGIVIVEAREGDGSATVEEKPVPLKTGNTLGLSQGQSARVVNSGTQPLLLRAYVVTTQ
jgi:hypothetical protein